MLLEKYESGLHGVDTYEAFFIGIPGKILSSGFIISFQDPSTEIFSPLFYIVRSSDGTTITVKMDKKFKGEEVFYDIDLVNKKTIRYRPKLDFCHFSRLTPCGRGRRAKKEIIF